MFDFPNSPTANQIVTGPGGVQYKWDTVKWVPAPAVYSPLTSGRNLIHNSLFNIAQRGAGPWTVGGYTMDRWATNIVSDTASWTQASINDTERTGIGDEAATNAAQNAFTGNAAAGAFNEIVQMVEGVRRLAGKTVIFSFYAIASSAGLKLGINATQSFGTGGSPSATVGALATGLSVTLTAAFARYSVTITLPSTAGKTLGTNGNDYTEIRICMSCGATNSAFFGNPGVQSGTIKLWGMQLEIAQPGQTQPTPLEKPDPADDLAKCQRFFQAYTGSDGITFWGYGATAWPIGYSALLPVRMRATPTVGNVTWVSASNVSGQSVGPTAAQVTFNANIAATGTGSFNVTFTLSADL